MVVKQKPEFRTCPVCGLVLLARDVTVEAVVDGRNVMICKTCNREAVGPQVFTEIPADLWEYEPPDTVSSATWQYEPTVTNVDMATL